MILKQNIIQQMYAVIFHRWLLRDLINYKNYKETRDTI